MSRDDELRDLMNKTASEIKRLSSNPRAWHSWMVYLLAALEKQAIGDARAANGRGNFENPGWDRVDIISNVALGNRRKVV